LSAATAAPMMSPVSSSCFTAGFLPRMTRMTRIVLGSAGQPSPHPLSTVGRLPTGANRRGAGEDPLDSQNGNCGSRARGDLAGHTWRTPSGATPWARRGCPAFRSCPPERANPRANGSHASSV
jgi:hypothetical protein